MEDKYLNYITKYLTDSSVMVPSPTEINPVYREDRTIKAVAFDVYGTILISASGDIDESEISSENLRTALDASGISISDLITDRQILFSDMLLRFRNEIIRVHHQERNDDRPYPEVDILKIWEGIIRHYERMKMLKLNGPLCIKCFTFVFELLSNSIYPMPGMKDVIMKLSEKGMPLGIVSNAQFYTPVILNFFMNNILSEENRVAPFKPELTVFSYEHMRSKPDGLLFEMLKDRYISNYGIYPREILFLGNDVFRDIYPAQRAGFKTALFAGDSRSLRLRKDRPEVEQVKPDYIITDLNQMLKIIT